MDIQTQPSDAFSSSYVYRTAPNSPNPYCTSSSNMKFYHSAPASPNLEPPSTPTSYKTTDHQTSNLDNLEFEFETSKKFNSQLHIGTSQDLESAIAFADELFLDGLLKPLKLPPNLTNQRSPFQSPKSTRTVPRIHFAHKWNDDFDPFMVALQKVREETRGRDGHHRRTRSYSPFRNMSKCLSVRSFCDPDVVHRGNSSKPSYSGPLEFKGSLYARLVQERTEERGLSPPRGAMTSREFLVEERMRLVEMVEIKPSSAKGKYLKGKREKSTMQKIKAILLRYAPFRRENSESKQKKTSSEDQKLGYFSRLSFKLKGKERIPADTTRRVVEYKPSSLAVCLVSGDEHPKKLI